MRNSRAWRTVLPLVATLGLLVPLSFAQQGMGGGRGMSRYDPSTEVTVKGTVDKVSQPTGPRGWPGTHVALKTATETLDVHLGPADFLAEKKFEIAAGDQVEVIGSKVKYNGADAILAREIKKGDSNLILRDAQGIPLWSRGRRH